MDQAGIVIVERLRDLKKYDNAPYMGVDEGVADVGS